VSAVAFFGLFTAHSDLARAGGTLVVGMTAGDTPVTTGNPDQGFEGYRFVGYNLYDALLLGDLSKADQPHQRLEFVPNIEYWDKARIPKHDPGVRGGPAGAGGPLAGLAQLRSLAGRPRTSHS
jgi:hypothetical protein